MSEIKIPTPGRIVQYWPNGKDKEAEPKGVNELGTEDPFIGYCPAIVISNSDNKLDLNVFSVNGVYVRLSVPSQSEITSQEPYWLWPSY